jgi:hypothetical protein
VILDRQDHPGDGRWSLRPRLELRENRWAGWLTRILLAVNPKQRMILLNVGVAGGLVVSYFRGAPLWIVALCGVFIFVLVNVISLIRLRKAQERSKDSN